MIKKRYSDSNSSPMVDYILNLYIDTAVLGTYHKSGPI